MGVWSASVSGSDTFQDAKDDYFDFFYHKKISLEEIESQIIELNAQEIKDEDDGEWHDIYFAIAYCEWKCGCLSEKILQIVKELVDSGKNLEYWKELDANPYILRQRKRELQKFIAKLESENPKPIKRRYKKPFVFPLKTGDVFACYSKVNGCYGCGVALEVVEKKRNPLEEEFDFTTLIALSDYTPKRLPSVEEVVNSKARDIFWNGSGDYNLPKRGIQIIGNVEDSIDKDYSNYFGAFDYNGRTLRVCCLRPNFDELVSSDKSKHIVDRFSVPDKHISFFFDKSNLLTTNEILEVGKNRKS